MIMFGVFCFWFILQSYLYTKNEDLKLVEFPLSLALMLVTLFSVLLTGVSAMAIAQPEILLLFVPVTIGTLIIKRGNK